MGALACITIRRRAAADEEIWHEPEVVTVPVPEPLPVVAPTTQPAPNAATPAPSPLIATAAPKPLGGLVTLALRPDITLDIQPIRAGIDSLRVSLDYALRVGNAGRAPAFAVSVESWLFGAGADPQAELAEVLALPAGEPQMPPFDLPPSGVADLAGQSITPREALSVINVGERRMFVPMLAVRARYLDRRGQQQVATAAFLIGAERRGQERLAPLALDRGSRAYDRLGVRVFGA